MEAFFLYPSVDWPTGMRRSYLHIQSLSFPLPTRASKLTLRNSLYDIYFAGVSGTQPQEVSKGCTRLYKETKLLGRQILYKSVFKKEMQPCYNLKRRVLENKNFVSTISNFLSIFWAEQTSFSNASIFRPDYGRFHPPQKSPEQNLEFIYKEQLKLFHKILYDVSSSSPSKETCRSIKK